MSTKDIYKKIIPIVLLSVVIIMVIAYILLPISGTLVCTNKVTPGDSTINYEYKIDFKFRKIQTIKIKQKIKSEDEKTIEKYKDILLDTKKTYEKDKYYNATIEVKKQNIIYNADINYKKINLKNTKSSNKKQTIGELKKNYERSGAICKYK